jgi:hypothetical protein
MMTKSEKQRAPRQMKKSLLLLAFLDLYFLIITINEIEFPNIPKRNKIG